LEETNGDHEKFRLENKKGDYLMNYDEIMEKFMPIDENTDFEKLLGYFGDRPYHDLPYCQVDILKQYWTIIPDEKKYNCFINVYTGMNSVSGKDWLIPMIQEIKKLCPLEAREELRQSADKKGYLTVYRGGADEDEPEKSFSWSLSKKVAHHFTLIPLLDDDAYIYTGKIHVDDVAAYTNERSEQEIIQYAQVECYDVESVFDMEFEEYVKNTNRPLGSYN